MPQVTKQSQRSSENSGYHLRSYTMDGATALYKSIPINKCCQF